MRIDRDRNAELLVEPRREAAGRRRPVRHFGGKANCRRDMFPADLGERLRRLSAGQPVEVRLVLGRDLPARDPAKALRLERRRFAPRPADGRRLSPVPGR